MKGPSDIPGVRTKGRSFLAADPKPATKVQTGAWYIYSAKNVYPGFFDKKTKPLLKRLKWKRFTNKLEFDRLCQLARAQNGSNSFITTQEPPEDVL
jgi:hypothetical protein